MTFMVYIYGRSVYCSFLDGQPVQKQGYCIRLLSLYSQLWRSL